MCYRTLCKSLPCIYFTLNSAGTIFSVSQFGATRLGYTAEELIGQLVFSLVHPDDQERLMSVIALCSRYNPAAQAELTSFMNSQYRVFCQDGTTLWVRAIALSVPNTHPSILLVWEDCTESYHLKAGLRQSERQFQAVFEAACDAMVITNDDGTPVEVNLAACRLFGLTREELMGCRIADLAGSDFNVEQIQATCQKNQREAGKLYLVSPDGTTRIVEYAASANIFANRHLLVLTNVTHRVQTPYVESDEELRQCHHYLEQLVSDRTAELTRVNQQLQQEISERIHTEEALRDSEYRYYKLAKVAPVGIFHTDAQGHCLYANQRWCEITGIPLAEVLGESWTQSIHPDDRERVVTEWYQATQENQLFQSDYRFQHPNGNTTWVIGQVCPEKGENGEIKGYIGTITDITERKQAEEALRESREKYRVLFQVFPIGISITDETGKIIEANPASERILGVSIEEHTQRKFDNQHWKIIRPDGTSMPADEYASVRALKEKRIIENVELGLVKPGHEITWINVTAAPIPLENHGVAIAYFDISERTRVEESLRQSEERYRRLFNSGNDAIFVYGVTTTGLPTHYTEVNDIACQILGYTREELLQLSPLDTYAPKKSEEIPALIKQLFAKQHHLFEMLMQTKNGRKILVEINAHLFELHGQPTILSTVRDITERQQTLEALRQQFLRERLMGTIQSRIRQSLDLKEILNTTVTEVRHFLQTDRVVIYRFEPDWSGVVIVESVDQQWTRTLGRAFLDTCLAKESLIQLYTQGRIRAVEDIHTAGLQECYVNFLAQYQVRANLVVPILQGERLWGLLVAQHCAQKRQWLAGEIELLKQLATQVGIAIQQAELYQQLEAANQELKRLATLDGLTQLANRRRFDEYLEQEWRRLAMEQKPLSLILCDIDFFKRYNDTYGHQAGDDCLKQVAEALCRAVKRPADLVARYGGEEFAVILPYTNDAGALCVAEFIREEVRNLRLAHGNSTVSPYVTLSLGVAGMIPRLDTTPAVLIAAADAVLYEAKARGRDRAVLRLRH